MDLEFQILKIVGYKTWSDRKKIDAMLEIDSNNYTNLGKDSLQKDKDLVKKQNLWIATREGLKIFDRSKKEFRAFDIMKIDNTLISSGSNILSIFIELSRS